MKKLYTLLFFLYFQFCYSQNPGEWVWIHGTNSSGSLGIFGSQGIASPSNDPPALYETCEWTDLNGNFWFYGGVDQGYGTHNDLWKYNPVTNEWTWMKGTNTIKDPGNYGTQGVPSPTNLPPAKGWGTASWVDLNGNLWLFGGYSTGYNSDLWKYNIATNEWTWIKGPKFVNQMGVYGTITIANTANNP